MRALWLFSGFLKEDSLLQLRGILTAEATIEY